MKDFFDGLCLLLSIICVGIAAVALWLLYVAVAIVFYGGALAIVCWFAITVLRMVL